MSSKLGLTIKQDKPFSSLEQELGLLIFWLANELGYEMAEVLKKEGLSTSQYNILRILRGAGETGHACNAIAERLVVKAPDITRLLDKLEKQNLITRQREQHDRRVVTARISQTGVALLDKLEPSLSDLQKKPFSNWTKAKKEQLLTLLEEVDV